MANEPLAFGYDYIPKRGVNVPLGAALVKEAKGLGKKANGRPTRADRAIPRNPSNINGWWRRGWDSNPRYGYPYNGFEF